MAEPGAGETDTARPDAVEPSITIHATLFSLVGGVLGASLLTLAGVYGVSAVGFRIVPTVLLVFGVFTLGVTLLDFPVASHFTPAGVRRRMLLRSQRFAWAEGDRLTRTRPVVFKSLRKMQHGGLTLVRGRRRYLLADRVESLAEYEALVAMLTSAGVEVGAEALPRPDLDVAPTWLYRRRRWRPDDASGR